MRMNLLRLSALAVLHALATVCLAAAPPSPQVQVVVALYRDFAFEAIVEEPTWQSPTLMEQPRHVLLGYFTPRLADLLLRDRRCVTTSREICRLDFMPLWGNQDPFGVAVQVLQSSTPEAVNVRLQYPSATSLLTFHLTRTRAGWRIQDISYGKDRASLLKLLEAKQ